MRRRVPALVCLAVVLSMTTWFSVAAITPDLVALRHRAPGERRV